MELGDLPQVVSLEANDHRSANWSIDTYARSIKMGYPPYCNFVLLIKNSIAGFCCAMVVEGEAELQNICIDQSLRRQGLGKHLLNHLLHWCAEQKMTKILLEVRSSNDSALRLYRSMGFVDDGVRARYYSNGEDALLMSRKLLENKES